MIGLVFGETDLPNQSLKKIKNKKYLIIDLTRKKLLKRQNSYPVSLGQFDEC